MEDGERALVKGGEGPFYAVSILKSAFTRAMMPQEVALLYNSKSTLISSTSSEGGILGIAERAIHDIPRLHPRRLMI